MKKFIFLILSHLAILMGNSVMAMEKIISGVDSPTGILCLNDGSILVSEWGSGKI